VTINPVAMAFYLLKLLGPRPTFGPGDMTADEAQLMGVHGTYWKAMLDRGVAIAFGPVIDPSGSWGLGIVKVEDEKEARALTTTDPVIMANRGFRYEFYPMLTVVSLE